MTATHRQTLAELNVLTVVLRDGVRELARKLRAVELAVFLSDGGGLR